MSSAPQTEGVLRSSAEPDRGASFRLGGLFLPILRWSVRLERDEQTVRDSSDSLHRSLKGSFVFLRRLTETTDLSYELKRGRSGFFVSDRWIEIEESFDIPAHEHSPYKVCWRSGAG
jgi:hypothetical protein